MIGLFFEWIYSHDVTLFKICITLAVVIALWYNIARSLKKNFPPRIRGLPFVGVLPHLASRPQQVLRKWALRLGPVMSVRIGMKDIVFLNTCDAINEALVKQSDTFSGRPSIALYNQVLGNNGITFMDYTEQQITSKKFAVNALKKLGFGKKEMENSINEEARYFSEDLKTKQNQPLNFEKEFQGILFNIMSKLVLGRRFDYEDFQMKKILKQGTGHAGDSKHKLILLHFHKFIRFFSPYKGVNDRFIEGEVIARETMQDIIEEHRKNFDRNNIRDFVDAYLDEQNRRRNKELFSDRQLAGCCRDMVYSGTNDILILLRWDLLCLLNHPSCLKQIVQEVDSVIGNDEQPTMAHKKRMPIISAFLQEVWRYCTIVPNAVLHRTTNDTMLNSFFIPKGTHVVPNLYAAHYDPALWSEPEKFDPHRHLDENKNFLHSTKIIPCSVGPRYCLGKHCAHIEEFIILTSLLKNFQFESATNPLPGLNDGLTTLVHEPPKFEVILRLKA